MLFYVQQQEGKTVRYDENDLGEFGEEEISEAGLAFLLVVFFLIYIATWPWEMLRSCTQWDPNPPRAF